MSKKQKRMSLAEACEMVPDDLPDGAYWAMAHDIANADYGDAWGDIAVPDETKKHKCPICNKGFKKDTQMRQHKAAAHKQQKQETP